MKIKSPYFVFFPVFLLVLLLSAYAAHQTSNRIKGEFASISKDVNKSILNRLRLNIEQLYAGKALFDSSEFVSRLEWNTFFNALDLKNRYPGIQSYQFLRFVPHEAKEEFIQAVRNDKSVNPAGYADFQITPEGERDFYIVGDYVEPLEGNQKAFGVDMAHEKENREGLATSRDSAFLYSTSRIMLDPETGKESGIIVYLPLYVMGKPVEQVEERRKAFLGFVSAAFKVNELFNGVVEEGHRELIDFALYDDSIQEKDVKAWSDSHLLYSSRKENGNLLASPSQTQIVSLLSVAGRNWTLVTEPTGKFLNSMKSPIPLFILIFGTIIAVLLFLTLRSFGKTRESLMEKESLLQEIRVKNTELIQTLVELKTAQEQLIQAEKMSSIGQLVAGLAHEINTPIGIGVTAASFLKEATMTTASSLKANSIKKSELDDYLQNAQKSSELILSNLRRTSELIGSFKMVSADQTHNEARLFELKEYCEEIILSLKPVLRKNKHQVNVTSSEPIRIKQNPGIFGQVVTNLVMNSLNHGFKDYSENGSIDISLSREKGKITIVYSDNGRGIPKENLPKIFDPFFTTTRGEGGTGLGLHIIYNIVTQSLKGEISCKSTVNHGATFIISFPENPE